MGALFTLLLGKITAVVGWISVLFVAIFVAFWDLITDAFSWLVEQFLDVSISAVNSMDLTELTNSAALGGWAGLPSELMNILVLIGVGTAIKIISGAIAIRLLLQLIPFVRLGS